MSKHITGCQNRTMIAAAPTLQMPRLRSSASYAQPARAQSKSVVHVLSLAGVWLTMAISGLVFVEPAPIDALQMGLIILLPVVGLVAINRTLVIYLALWLVVGAGGFLAVAKAPDMSEASTFTFISLYLSVASFVFAAFIARSPIRHTQLILNGWTFAALIVAVAGIIGYTNTLPGAYELFTKYGRLTGTFKDPNAAGPFMIPPLLYMLHLTINRPAKTAMIALATAGILALAVLMTFSRGAWMGLVGAVTLYGYFSFVTVTTNVARARIAAMGLAAVIIAVVGLVVAMQFDSFATLMSDRAAVTKSYDIGPEGRFGGQSKAVGLIATNPIGLGAQAFTSVHHNEEAHNVYLSMLMNAGWIGGGVYWILVALTLVLGLRHALRATPNRPLFLIVYASFTMIALEGAIIDTDHWRYFYLLMGLVWGFMAAPNTGGGASSQGSSYTSPSRPPRILEPAPLHRPARILQSRSPRRPVRFVTRKGIRTS